MDHILKIAPVANLPQEILISYSRCAGPSVPKDSTPIRQPASARCVQFNSGVLLAPITPAIPHRIALHVNTVLFIKLQQQPAKPPATPINTKIHGIIAAVVVTLPVRLAMVLRLNLVHHALVCFIC